MKNQLILFILLPWIIFSQETITISGNVKDFENGESLIGATIFIPELKIGTSTNNYGWFSITIPDGQYNAQISYIGYITEQLSILSSLNNNEFTISLKKTSNKLDEVKLQAERKDINIQSSDIGKVELEIKKIDQLPVLMGEKDILKTIQLLPGIQSGGEGTSGFYVRGGGPDQNLILLDEAVVYNASHLFGFFSVFNIACR